MLSAFYAVKSDVDLGVVPPDPSDDATIDTIYPPGTRGHTIVRIRPYFTSNTYKDEKT